MIGNKMTLQFKVNKQTLERLDDNVVVEKSINFLYIKFLFSDEWKGLTKYAVFNGVDIDNPYRLPINKDGVVKVPYDLITFPGFVITVQGVEGVSFRITAETKMVDVELLDNLEGKDAEDVRYVTSINNTINIHKDGNLLDLGIVNDFEYTPETCTLDLYALTYNTHDEDDEPIETKTLLSSVVLNSSIVNVEAELEGEETDRNLIFTFQDGKEIVVSIGDFFNEINNAVKDLQDDFDDFKTTPDVKNVFLTKSELNSYSTTKVNTNDIVEVLVDESRNNQNTYYKWVGNQWTYMGGKGPFYTQDEVDLKLSGKQEQITANANAIAGIKNGQSINSFAQVESALTGNLKRLIVQSLPTEDIDLNTIYMVLDPDSVAPNNIYNEYMYIENDWELIGTTQANGVEVVANPTLEGNETELNSLDVDGVNYKLTKGILGDSSAPIHTRASSKVLDKFNTYVSYSTYYNWNDGYQIDGQHVWTDGENIYYDFSDTHLQFDKVNKTWSVKTWTNAPISMVGRNIWTDGENIYYNFSKVLNKSTSTWENKTWTFSPSASIYFNGQDVWTDGTTLYVSNGTDQYYLDKSNNTWKVKTWNGRSNITGSEVWTDGTNIYYYGTYKLNKFTNTWESFTFNNTPSNFNCEKLWSDGTDVYYSYGNDSYMLDKKTATWIPVNLGGFTFYYGGVGVWTDGEYLYNSTGTNGRTNTYFRLLKNTLRSTKPLMEEYTAGTNVSIKNNVISATDTTYTAGEGIEITSGNVINNTQDMVIANPTLEGTEPDLTSLQVGTTKYKSKEYLERPATAPISVVKNYKKFRNTWVSTTIPKPSTSTFYGYNIFRFKNHTYYKDTTNVYEFNKTTETWELKNWTEITENDIRYGGFFTDGRSLFLKQYSSSTTSSNYLRYNEDTDTWSAKTISGPNYSGFTNFGSGYVWTDGCSTYYSKDTEHYRLQYSASSDTYSWYAISWRGLTSFNSGDIWTDGVNTYLTTTSKANYILSKKSYNTWESVTFNNMPNQWWSSTCVWSDGEDIYYDMGSFHKVLDKTSLTWLDDNTSGLSGDNISGSCVWTDGDNYYRTYNNTTIKRLKNGVNMGRTTLSPYATESYVDNHYTAGTGINITNGVISTTGGSISLYRHDIFIKNPYGNCATLNIYNNSSTALTFYDVCKYVYDKGFTGSNKYMHCSGVVPAWDNYGYVIIGCYVNSDPATVQNYQLDAYAMCINLDSSITDHFTESTIAISSYFQTPTVRDVVTQIL